MKKTYSLYDAKAHLSAIVRQVREGQSVIVTVHGEPAVEIRPVERPADTPEARLEARIKEMIAAGMLTPAKNPKAKIRVGKHVPGGLQRFLDDRNE